MGKTNRIPSGIHWILCWNRKCLEVKIHTKNLSKRIILEEKNKNNETFFAIYFNNLTPFFSSSYRFPYLCFKNGGGAFLVPYFILIVAGGVPMYYLEILMGQYTRSGTIKIWDICPIFRGVGIGITIMNMFVNVYFIIIMTWSMHFMFAR